MINRKMLLEWMQENDGAVLFDTMHEGVFTGYITITPARANEMLENNTHNRKLGKKRQLELLKKEIVAGNWDDNVAKINFTKDDILSDGQHRLYACSLTGKTIRCLVTHGVENKAQLVTDRRGARSLKDDLEILGVKDASNVAAIGRVVYYLNKGIKISSIVNHGEMTSNEPDSFYYDFIVENRQEIEEKKRLAERAYNHVKRLGVKKTVINVLSLKFDEINSEDAAAFWKKLDTGVTNIENDPIMLLRRRLEKEMDDKKSEFPANLQTALIIKAWNFYMKGEQVKQLKFTIGGANPEPFPEIYNPYAKEENKP